MTKTAKEKKTTASADTPLPSMSLYLEAAPQSVWGNPEPEDYVVEISGSIRVLGESDVDMYVHVGQIVAYRVNFGQALNDKCSWYDVLDAQSADLANYLALVGPDWGYTEWVQDQLENPGDLLVLHKIRIESAHRGHGYGLLAAQLMMDSFGTDDTLVACIPAPYELLEKLDAHRPGEPIPGWEKASEKLRNYWKPLGFRRVPKTDIFVLSRSLIQPPIEKVMQAYYSKKGRG